MNKNFILSNKIKPRTPISMTKRTKRGKQEISMRIPDSALIGGIQGGIPEERQRSTISASHSRYIATVYNIMMKEATLRDGQDPAGAWSQ